MFNQPETKSSLAAAQARMRNASTTTREACIFQKSPEREKEIKREREREREMPRQTTTCIFETWSATRVEHEMARRRAELPGGSQSHCLETKFLSVRLHWQRFLASTITASQGLEGLAHETTAQKDHAKHKCLLAGGESNSAAHLKLCTSACQMRWLSSR